jgi:hypothetical protein
LPSARSAWFLVPSTALAGALLWASWALLALKDPRGPIRRLTGLTWAVSLLSLANAFLLSFWALDTLLVGPIYTRLPSPFWLAPLLRLGVDGVAGALLLLLNLALLKSSSFSSSSTARRRTWPAMTPRGAAPRGAGVVTGSIAPTPCSWPSSGACGSTPSGSSS